MKILTAAAVAGALSITLSSGGEKLVSVVNPTGGNIARGIVTFEQVGDLVSVKAIVTGLKPGQKHAIHVHEFGDVSSLDAKSAGGHFNPLGHPHGLPETSVRHAGDLGNLQADERGVGVMRLNITKSVLPEGIRSLAGRAVIVHAKADDGGQPTGNAGPRIGAGVIGYGNPATDAFTSLDVPGREHYLVLIADDSSDGVAERAGENIDAVGEKVAEEVGEAARETGRALRKIGKAIEKELSN